MTCNGQNERPPDTCVEGSLSDSGNKRSAFRFGSEISLRRYQPDVVGRKQVEEPSQVVELDIAGMAKLMTEASGRR